MKRLIASSLIALASTSTAFCEEVLREISWIKLRESGELTVGELLPGQSPAPVQQWVIENAEATPKKIHLLTIEDPGISGSRYAVTGQVRYEEVEGKGFLEMWNHFPDGTSYFTRSLAQTGPMQSLEGTSNWREFSLPFFIDSDPRRPEKLVLNLVLSGRGTVYLGPPKLVQYADSENPLAAAGAWWGDRAGGTLGTILGIALGCLGGLIGILAGMGKARPLVLGLMKATIVGGLLLLVAGVMALLLSQPYCVWYPLVMIGILSSAIMGGSLPVVRRGYQQRELRKMTALDVDAAVPEGAGRKPAC